MNRKPSFFLWLILALGSCNKTKEIPVSPAGVDVYITGNGPFTYNSTYISCQILEE